MNKTKSRRTLPITSALLLFAGVHATALSAGSGRIIDEETGKPLANVFVMATWRGHVNLGAIGKTICYDFAMTQTDADGRFSLRDWSWNINPFVTSRSRASEVYLQEYVWSTNNFLNEGQSRADSGEIKLKKYEGPVMERLVELAIVRYIDCMSEYRMHTLLPFFAARYEEAQRIAKTPEEKKRAQDIKNDRDFVGRWSGALPRNPDGSIVK